MYRTAASMAIAMLLATTASATPSWLQFYDWRDVEYTVTAQTGLGPTTVADIDSEPAVLFGLGAGIEFPFRREYRLIIDTDYHSASYDGADDAIGATMHKIGVSLNGARRYSLNREINLWGGLGTGVSYARYSDVHTTTGDGQWLGTQYDDQAVWGSTIRVFGRLDYRINRQLSFLVSPRYEYTLTGGTRFWGLASGVSW